MRNVYAHSLLDATSSDAVDPLWGIKIGLTDVERALLQTQQLRRLHFIKHCGGSSINSHVIFSRLQHTLGVWSLISYFCPEDIELRVAALLHDIAHLPFSHTLEKALSFDHHNETKIILTSGVIKDILSCFKT